MSTGTEMIRRFTRRHALHHWVMLLSFFGLVLTGMPQKFADQGWAKGIVLIFGGVERIRLIHHWLGGIMAFQVVWYAVEMLWVHHVRRMPMPMLPRLSDVREFMLQVRYNLGRAPHPPSMDRYTFAEKLEYWALVWGTVLMVLTGVLLLYPVRFASFLPGEAILAAKAAHGGEAILAILSILTWHLYFVQVRHRNRSIFNGMLEAEAYAEEHAIELERIRRGEVAKPAEVTLPRLLVFAIGSALVIGAALAVVLWLRAASVPVPTIPL